ncbi:MAG: hypothetical protein AAGI72_15885 [Pseudomonadota bacterium]
MARENVGFSLRDFFSELNEAGRLPVSLVHWRHANLDASICHPD